MPGSSPLTRGKRAGTVRGRVGYGLIPAHAGKTPSTASSSTKPPAHPRSRGENRLGLIPACRSPGSSPLTRGKPASVEHVIPRSRLIPAHAGKTLYAWRPSWHVRAHPRSRGENLVCVAAVVARAGSSPLTRGKRGRKVARLKWQGLIPAHAGKTVEPRQAGTPARAHPRSRGENHKVRPIRRADLGSSPLTRGKRQVDRKTARARGLIPAHAGKTRNQRPIRVDAVGSSPLTRGKR